MAGTGNQEQQEATDTWCVVGEVVSVHNPWFASTPGASVHTYEYFMNGQQTGRLHLGLNSFKCSWSSHKTGSTTGWHGEWHKMNNGSLVCFFDCKGRIGTGKWALVKANGQGLDYKGMSILMRFDRPWSEIQLQQHHRCAQQAIVLSSVG